MNAPATLRAAGMPAKTILGVEVCALGGRDVVSLLDTIVAEQRFTRVGFLNAHSANVAYRNAGFAEVLDGFLVLPDGLGVDLAARFLTGSKFPDNLNGTDFVPGFLRTTGRPMTVAMVGASRRNAAKAREAFAAIAPQHRFVLVSDGFFDAAGERDILERLLQLRPDVLLVAMGVPRQEEWIARNITGDHCTLPIAVGALFDFMSGAIPRAPVWMRHLRLEWLFRLILEPSRLWRRYILGNPVFIARVVRERLARTP